MEKTLETKIEKLKGKLIVSCQALPNEPLHASFIMGKMALAAACGGAAGIRANSVEDIREIKKNVKLPIIGIIKKEYENNPVFITPTIKEVEALVEEGVEIIAIDATNRERPDKKSVKEFYEEIRRAYPDQLLMADCATVKEALYADELGFDFIGTTLVGYTEESRGMKIEKNDFEIIRSILGKVKGKVIAEGNIDTCEKEKRVIELGCYCVVIGSIITRPQYITERFVKALENL